MADVPVDMTVAEDDVELELAELLRSSSPVPSQPRSASLGSNTPTPHPRVQALISKTQPKRLKRRRSNDPTATEQQLLDILTQPTTTPSPYIPKPGEEMYYLV